MEDFGENLAEKVKFICIEQMAGTEQSQWFKDKLAPNLSKSFFLTFGLIGRKIERRPVQIDDGSSLHFDGWHLDELCRLCLLLHLPTDENVPLISQLVAASDMREQVVIYKSLAYLTNAAQFNLLAIDGIRTNMTDVFDAIALDNTFPQKYFSEEAWNQMVLKAIFMERPIHRIIGLDIRKNQKLADILYDYVHERWSANRDVIPEIWRLMPGFINEAIFKDLQTVVEKGSKLAKAAALKALSESNSMMVKKWLADHPFDPTPLSWEQIGTEIRKNA